MSTYKDLFFRAIDQLVGNVVTDSDKKDAKKRIKEEIIIEENRLRWSNYKKHESLKDKFQKFYNDFEMLDLISIAEIAKNLVNYAFSSDD